MSAKTTTTTRITTNHKHRHILHESLNKRNNTDTIDVEPISFTPLPNGNTCDDEADIDIAEFLIDFDDESKHKKRPHKQMPSLTNLWTKLSISIEKSGRRNQQRPSTPKMIQQTMKSNIFDLTGNGISSHRAISTKKQKIQGSKVDSLILMKTDSFDLEAENIYNNLIVTKEQSESIDNLNFNEIRKEDPNPKLTAIDCAIRKDAPTECPTEQSFPVPSYRGNAVSSELFSQNSSSDREKRHQVLMFNMLSSMESSEISRAELRKLNLPSRKIRDLMK